MRLAIATLSLLLVAATGYCTGVYVEQADDHQPGFIKQGDVFEYYCELPAPLQEEQQLSIRVHYPNGELLEALFSPRIIYGSEVALYP